MNSLLPTTITPMVMVERAPSNLSPIQPSIDGAEKNQRGKCAPGEIGVIVGEADLVDHEQHEQRGHAVIAETLLHFSIRKTVVNERVWDTPLE